MWMWPVTAAANSGVMPAAITQVTEVQSRKELPGLLNNKSSKAPKLLVVLLANGLVCRIRALLL